MKFNYKILLSLIILTSCSSNTDNPDNPDCKLTPTLSTQEVSNVMDTSANFSGQIIAPTCESTVTSQGFVYAKTTLPKTDDFIIELSGENISSDVSNLERNTIYFMRTFFVNPTGEYYGNQVEFKTAIGDIDITTKNIENITSNSAKSGGVIDDDGGAEIISQGVCWSTSTNPTINDYKIQDSSGSSNFNSELIGLLEDTTYYVRAFATNENGTTYGNEVSFSTLKPLYNVELIISGSPESCGVRADYFYYELNYKFDDNDIISEAAEGGDERNLSHSKEGTIKNNLEVTIHLAQFNSNTPNETTGKGSLDNMSIKITHLGSNQVVLDISLQSLFICTDSAYKNIINFNPNDGSHTVERLTYGF